MGGWGTQAKVKQRNHYFKIVVSNVLSGKLLSSLVHLPHIKVRAVSTIRRHLKYFFTFSHTHMTNSM